MEFAQLQQESFDIESQEENFDFEGLPEDIEIQKRLYCYLFAYEEEFNTKYNEIFKQIDMKNVPKKDYVASDFFKKVSESVLLLKSLSKLRNFSLKTMFAILDGKKNELGQGPDKDPFNIQLLDFILKLDSASQVKMHVGLRKILDKSDTRPIELFYNAVRKI